MAQLYSNTLSVVNDVAQSPAINTSSIGVTVSGTWAGTIVFEGSRNKGTTWTTVSVLVDNGSGVYSLTEVTQTTANGAFAFQTGSFTHLRARLSVATSGSAVVSLSPSTGAISRDVQATKNDAVGVVLQTTTSQVTVSSTPSHLVGIHIHTALTGSLTITGLLDDTGSARNWVIPAGTVGTVMSGTALLFSTLRYTLSSSSDAAKVLLSHKPL